MRALILSLLVVAPALLASAERPPVDCTFSNPRFAGKCVEQVTPTDQESSVRACQAILGCLNDSRCVKTYCNATTIRGGWLLDSPKAERKKK